MRIKDIPDKFSNMVQPKEESNLSKPDFEFIVPSGQFWYDLTLEEQAQLRQIVATAGEDLDDYLYQMRRMLPRDPEFRRRNH